MGHELTGRVLADWRLAGRVLVGWGLRQAEGGPASGDELSQCP